MNPNVRAIFGLCIVACIILIFGSTAMGVGIYLMISYQGGVIDIVMEVIFISLGLFIACLSCIGFYAVCRDLRNAVRDIDLKQEGDGI